MLNGEREPQVVWKAGARHRVRLINITTDDIFTVTLQTTEGPGHVASADQGRRAAATRAAARPAPRSQPIGVGETYDFEVQAPPGARRCGWKSQRPAASGRLRGT